MERPIILTFIGNYLPGFKAGGILRTIVNTVDHLCNDFDFWIVTRDRDLGEEYPYKNIKVNQWQKVGNAMVYYLSSDSLSVKNISDIIANTPHQILYLNSFFEPLTVKALFNRRFGNFKFRPVIVASRGEFAWASLKIKYPKKLVFMLLARAIGLYDNILWHASSSIEAKDIMRVMKIKAENIYTAIDLPFKMQSSEQNNSFNENLPPENGLKIIFLSRISREKNLDYALKVLSKVKANVCFDIYGPDEDKVYWKECQDLIDQLPPNISVKYCGTVKPSEVVQIFGCYNLYLFPTGGENYGHTIAESLIAGTPVLISSNTPWYNLQADGFGWDIDLNQIDEFVNVIEEFALINKDEYYKMRILIKEKIKQRLWNPALLEENRQLFKRLL